MNKILLLLLLGLLQTYAQAAEKIILEGTVQGKKILISQDENFLSVKTHELDKTMPIKKCSQTNYNNFLKKMEGFSKSISMKLPNAFEVTILGHQKTVPPQSTFGKYLTNLSQHLITLNNEMAIACKRK